MPPLSASASMPDTVWRADALARPAGTVLAIGEAGIEVAAAGGSVLLARLGVGGKKLPAAEAAGLLGLTVGTRLATGRVSTR